MSHTKNACAGVLTAVFVLCAASSISNAQPTTPQDSPRAATTNDREDMDWGWLGLIGLAGLAGLMGRRRDDVGVRTTTSRPTH